MSTEAPTFIPPNYFEVHYRDASDHLVTAVTGAPGWQDRLLLARDAVARADKAAHTAAEYAMARLLHEAITKVVEFDSPGLFR